MGKVMKHLYLWLVAFVQLHKRRAALDPFGWNKLKEEIAAIDRNIDWYSFRQAQCGAHMMRMDAYMKSGMLEEDFRNDWNEGKAYRWGQSYWEKYLQVTAPYYRETILAEGYTE
jgi:hypothetical protein